jgi:hypothetical protein
VADGFTSTVDASALLAMLDRVGPSLEFHTRDVARETAKRVAVEATSRVSRREGITASGIHWEMSRDGKGYVVMAYEAGKQAPVDKYLEAGTKFMRARPFFFASAEIENGPHLRRMEERVQQVLSDLGR